jgi:hypothetical protein
MNEMQSQNFQIKFFFEIIPQLSLQEITHNFCDLYYTLYKQDRYDKISQLFARNSLITVNQDTMYGFENYVGYLRKICVNRLEHRNCKYSSQVVENCIVISVVGDIVINYLCEMKFSETVILEKKDETYMIRSSLLNLTEKNEIL